MLAVVTGASAGIGTAFARALAARGYDLVLVARRQDRLEALSRELGREGRKISFLAADLTEPGTPGRVYETAQALGPVDLLINNAGFGIHGPFHKADHKRIMEMMRLNIDALVALTHLFLPGMVERRRGTVIQVASTGAFQPIPFMAAYAASKAFVLSFTEALAVELQGTGVRVKVLCPGPTDSEFAEVAAVPEGLRQKTAFYMSAEAVVELTLSHLENRKVVLVPGLLNRLGALSAGMFPRALIARVAGRIFRPPTQKALPAPERGERE